MALLKQYTLRAFTIAVKTYDFGRDECIFFLRIRQFLLTLDSIDILCLVY